jgi:inosine/xanthosine triphosphatase
MKVGVGSKNKTKVTAVAEMLQTYPLFDGAEVEGVEVHIEEFGHPKNIEETVSGAIERAKQAYVGHDYGFGIEGGLMQVPHTKTGFMEVAVCAIYDGKQIHIGLSSAFEWPREAFHKIMHEGLDGSQATKSIGLTDNEKVGEQGGTISILTNGRMTRMDQNKAAVTTALIHLEHPDHY